MAQSRWRLWLSEKLNPAQGGISGREVTAPPVTILKEKEAYNKIEVVNRAVEVIINALCEIPFIIEENSRGPVLKIDTVLNYKPNSFEDTTRFFRKAYLDFILEGNTFFYWDGKELYILPAENVTIVSDPKTFIHHYEYSVNTVSSATYGQYGKLKNEKIIFEPNEIIHVKSDNSDSIYRGVSRLKSLENLISIYYHLLQFQKQFFLNNAVPGITLSTEQVLGEKVKSRLLQNWRESYSSVFNSARSPAILDGGLKVDKFSEVSFKELEFEKSLERIQQDICKGMGVPYVLLKSGNNANIVANEKLFYYHTVLPILQQFTSAFRFYFQLDIRPDLMSVPSLRPDERVKAIYWATLTNSGISTPNEARIDIKLPPKEGLDEIREPKNITGSAVNPSVGGRPTESGTPGKTRDRNNDA